MHLPLTKNFIPNKEASRLSGYNSDYIARLCREGKIEGKRIGRAWFVNRESLQRFMRQQDERRKELSRELSLTRGREYDARQTRQNPATPNKIVKSSILAPRRAASGPKLSDIHPTLRPGFALALTALVVMCASVAAGSGAVDRVASRIIIAAAVSEQQEGEIPDHVALAVYRVGDGLARATSYATLAAPRAYREGVLALASTPRDQAAAVATVPAIAEHGIGSDIAEATYRSVTGFFSRAMDKLATLFGFQVEHLAVLPFEAASTLHAPTSLPAPIITESGAVTYVGGPVTQHVYATTYVTGASTQYVDNYVSTYVTTALNALRQQIGADVLDGQYVHHSTPSTSSGGSASSVSGGTITNSTITNSTFSGGTIVADALTVSGTTTLSAAATITGPITFAGITGSTQCLHVDASGVVSGTGSDCGAGGGGITGIKAQYSSAQTGATQTFATSSDTNLQLTITSSGDTHTFTPVWTGVLSVARGGTGLSSVAANQLLIGNSAGTGYTAVATSSLGLSTADISENGNLYYTLSRFAAALAGTTTDALAEGVINKYYTDARARSAFNATATGLSYATTTGTLSLASGYEIPLSASTSNWNSFYATPSSRITAGTNLSWSGNTLNGPSDSYMRGLLAVTSPLSYDNTTGTFSISQASSIADGYLSAADWTTFNGKVSSTSLSAAYPVQYDSGTGAFSLAFGTTTNNTWAGTQTFTNTLATNATTTSLGINSETFTDLTGTGLQNVGGALTLNATGDWTGTFDGQEGSYYLANSFSTTSASYFIAQNQGAAYSTTSANYWLTTKSTSDLAEGTNLYWTNTRFDARLAATTSLPNLTTLSNLSTIDTSLTGLVKAASGALSAAVAGTDYENPLTFAYPLVRSVNAISLAFGTTTPNSWSAHNIFTSLFATNASTTNATTTSLGINSETFTDLTGTGLQNVGGALTLNATGDWTGTFDGQEGSYYLANSFSTTSANAYLATKSTTNLAEGTNLYYTDARVNAYIHASTTIPKTYTSNTFTNSNTFSGTLTVGSLNGPLQANAGVVSATSSIGVLYGGTGLTAAPAYGNLLLGNASGGYTLTATSSLGIALADTTGTLAQDRGGTGLSSYAAGDVLYADGSGNLTTLPVGSNGSVLKLQAGLPSWGVDQTVGAGGSGDGIWATSTNLIYPIDTASSVVVGANATATTNSIFEVVGQSYFSSKIGIGTTSPSQLLSVSGNGYFTGGLGVGLVNTTAGTLRTSGNASIGGTLTIGSLNGPLQANAGIVSATSSIGVLYGGTGLTSAPAYGQLLLGNASGGYTLTATSSLGLAPAFTATYPIQYSSNVLSLAFGTTTANSWSALQQFDGGFLSTASSTVSGPLTVTSTTTTGTLAVTGTGTSTIAGNISLTGSIIPTADNTYSLGSATNMWKEVYIGPGSLYINGQKVLQEDVTSDIVVSADPDQNLKVKTSGSGNLELNPSGTGQILVKNTVNVTAGKSITTSDLSALPIPNGVTAGNITVSGNAISATNLNGGISLTPTGAGGVYVTTGSFGIGTTTPGALFAVQGDGLFSGNLSLANLTATGIVSTPGLTLGTLNGPLQANAGVVSATSSIGVLYGGTGLTTAPTYGQLLVGNASGGYTLMATSSLGVTANFTATYPLQFSANVLSLAFGTTTSNTWAGTQTFTNTPVVGSLSGLVGANNGTLYQIATSTNFITSIAQSSGSAQTGAITLATSTATSFNGLTVSNAITNSSGTFTFAPNTITGTLNVAGGGTGITSVADGALVIGSSATALTSLATSTGGTILQTSFTTGRPTWVATSSLGLAPAFTATYPIQYSSNVLSLAFGTTTANSWSALQQFNGNASTTQLTTTGSTYLATASGNVGIGTTTTSAKLHVVSTTEQMRLGYDLSNYTSFTTGSGGDLTINPSGGDISVSSNNLTGTGVLSFSNNSDGNRIGDLIINYHGSSNPEISSAGGTLVSASTLDFTSGGITADAAKASSFSISHNRAGQDILFKTATTSSNSEETIITIQSAGDTVFNYGKVGIGSTTPYAKLAVKGTGTGTGVNFQTTNSSNSPTFTVLDNGTATFTGGITSSATSANTFPYASTTALTVSGTNGLSLGSLNGPLQANNGAVSATTSIGVLYGGTGLTSAPAYGNILVGNASGGYALTATSSLGLAPSFTATYPIQYSSNILSLAFGTTTANSWSALQQFNAGASTTQLTTTDNAYLATVTGSVGIGTTSPAAKLEVAGGSIRVGNGATNAYQFLNASNAYNSTRIYLNTSNALRLESEGNINFKLGGTSSSFVSDVLDSNSVSLFRVRADGTIGIGTTTPYAKLSVVGQVVGAYFTATTTTASTFPYASTTALTVSGTNGLSLGSLNGPLQANNGAVSATTSIGVLYGGTGLTSAPSYGQLLLGNASGGYTLTATSSLGITGTTYWTSSGSDLYNNTGTEIGINNTSPAYALDVAGYINTDQFSGYKQAGNTILYASSTRGTTLVGVSAGAALTTSSNNVVAVGKGALQYSTASSNTAVGFQALNVDTSGDLNVAVGTYALASNDTGAGNIAVGYGASYNGLPVTGTVAIGQEAANGIGGAYTASGSVAIGYRAGYSFYNASNYNTLLGYQSGYNISTGANNIIIGADSGTDGANSNLTTGSNNIQIGYNISLASSTGSNQLNIGNLIYGTGLDGSGSTLSTGKIGIGTSSPGSQLEIANTAGAGSLALSGNSASVGTTFTFNDETTAASKLLISLVPSGASNANLGTVPLSSIIQTAAGSTGGLILDTKTSAPIIFATGGSTLANERVRIDSVGNVGIGTTSPYAKLSVVGQIVGAYFTATTTTASTFPYASTTALTVSGQANIGSLAGASVSSLTANYLPKWNSGTFANSTIYDTGTNVGIGTTTPGTQLSISSASAPPFIKLTNDGEISVDESYGGIQFEGMDAGGSGVRAQIQAAGDGVNGQSYLAFSTRAGGANALTEYLRISSGGSVGIGTTSPWKMLSVAGDSVFTGKVYAGADSKQVIYVPDQTNFVGSFLIGTGGLSLSHTTAQEGQANTGIGIDALRDITTGDYNTGGGNAALRGLTTGNLNTAFGHAALMQLQTGSSNTGIGRQSQYNLQTGSSNTALGYLSLYNNTSGSFNTVLGGTAGIGSAGVSDVSNETIVGYAAGSGLLTGGDNNTFLGYRSGYTVTTGTYNIILGNFTTTGGVTTGSNNILIGEDVRPASTTSSNQLNIGNLLYGTGLGNGTTAGTGNIGIGTSSPYSRLAIWGASSGNIFEAITSASSSAFTISNTGAISVSGAITSTAASANTFPYASTTALTVSGSNGLVVGTLNGPLQANNGVVSATTSISVLYGGTGLTSVSDGRLVLGSSATALTSLATSTGGTILQTSFTTGRPTWVATSTLGLAPAFTATYPIQYSSNILSLAFGTTTANSWSALQQFNAGASTTQLTVTGNTYLATASGNVGIGTTSPWANLHTVGTGGDASLAVGTQNAVGKYTVGNTSLDIGRNNTSPFGWYLQSRFDNAATAGPLLLNPLGGNVGIGTTSPWANLSVNSTAGTPQFAIGSTTTQFVVDKNGNVGVGVSTPVAPVDIYGGSGDGTVNEAFGLRIRGTSTSGNSATLQLGANGVSYTYIQSAYWGGGYTLPLNLNPKGGAVYINAPSSSSATTTKVSLETGGDILVHGTGGSNTQLGRIGFTSSAYHSLPAFIGAYADNGIWSNGLALTFNTISSADVSGSDGLERLRITSAGNVGIGSTSPSQLLSVAGNGYLTGGLGIGVVNTTAGSLTTTGNITSTAGQLSIGNVFTANVTNGVNLISNYGYSWTTDTGLFRYAAGVVEVGTSPNSGNANGTLLAANIGIGTTSPYAPLSVVGQVVGAYFTATTTTASTFPYASTTALTVSGTNGLVVGTLNGPLQANNGVVSATTSVGLLYGGTATTTFYNGGVVFSDGTKLTQAANSANKTFFWDNTNGRLGLGTSSPAASLSITQASNSVRAFELFDTEGSPTTHTALIQRTSNIGAGGTISNAMLRLVDNAANYPLSIETTAGASLLAVDGNGGSPLVGIGSSTPYATLSVRGAGSTTGVNFQTTNSAATPLFSIYDSGNVAIGTTTAPQKLTLAGNILGYADTPTLVGGTGTLTGSLDAVQGVAVQGRYAYVVAGGVADDLAVIDVSQPASPVIVGTTTAGALGGDAGDVVVNGNYVYVAVTAVDRLSIVDVSDPSHPTVVGSVTSSTQLDGITNLSLNGQYLYITSSVDDLISVVDVSDPTHPVVVGSNTPGINNLNDAQDIAIQGNYAFVSSRLGGDGLATSAHLAVFDITNPTDPQLVATTTSTTEMNDARGLYASGRYLYVGSLAGDALVIYDISNPRAPAQVGALTSTNLDGAFYVKVRGNYAYVSVNVADGIAVVDVSDPTAPVYVTKYTSSSGTGTLDGSYRFDIVGQYLYGAANIDDAFTILNIGSYLPAASIGSLAAQKLDILDNVSIGAGVKIGGALNLAGSFQNTGGINSFVTSTSTTAGTMQGINSLLLGKGIVTTGTDTTYNVFASTTRIGATGGTINTYGGYFTVAGDTGGTSQAVGLYASASGADSNYAAIFANGNVGIGTTSPGSLLSVQGNALFAGSLQVTSLNATSTATIGTLTLTNALTVANGGTGAATFTSNGILYGNGTSALQVTAAGAAGTILTGTGGAPAFSATPTLTSLTAPTLIGGTAAGSTLTLKSTSGAGTTDAILFLVGNNGATEAMRILSNGNVGIGTTTPGTRLAVQNTASAAQFSIAYDTTRYTNLQVDSSGDFLVTSQGKDTRLNDENLWVCAGGACPAGTPAGTGNLLVETALGIGSSSPSGASLAISETAGTPAFWIGSTTLPYLDVDKNGYIGIATSSPWSKFTIANGAVTVQEQTIATSTSMTIDWRNGNQQLIRVGTAGTTISFSGYVAGERLMLSICNPNATAGAISWGTQILWSGGSAPTQTTTANKCDIWSFVATNATSTIKILGAQTPNF